MWIIHTYIHTYIYIYIFHLAMQKMNFYISIWRQNMLEIFMHSFSFDLQVVVTWNNVQPPCNTCVHCTQISQDHGNHLGWTLSHMAYAHPQVAMLCQLLSMLPTNVAVDRSLISIWQVLAFLSLRHVQLVGFDLRCSGDGRIPYYHDVVRLHKPIRLMPIPPALHWNLKMPTSVSVDDGGDLIVLIRVVHRCHSITACHNVVDCLQACKWMWCS